MKRDDVLRMWKQAQHLDLTDEDIAVRFASLVAAAEREVCAKICEEGHEWDPPCFQCHVAIRARAKV